MKFPTTIATATIGRVSITFSQTAPDRFAVDEHHTDLDVDEALRVYSEAVDAAVRATMNGGAT